mmetsp:Transcript_23580/g.36775  ORF Transcript_23580/g.36775 Transcript_23580/m.36775 type:complete len:148 (-) Transcript_23580:27-470(-)
MGNANTVVIVVFVLVFLATVIGPNVFFLVAGAKEIDAPCQRIDGQAVSLSVWLIVFSSVPLGGGLVICLVYSLLNRGLGVLLMVPQVSFLIGWLIYGSILVSRADECEKKNSFLYNSALAAVILGWVNVPCSLLGCLQNTGDNEDYS